MLARANEQAVVEKATLSLLTIVTKRGVRNVETALKALSTPFGLTPRVSSALDGSNVYEKSSPISRSNSDVTLPSMLDLTPEIVSSAEEIIQNARRKHAILIGIIVKLQRLGRAFLIRNRSRGRLRNRDLISKRVENDLLKRQASAAVLIQSWVRTYLARYVFTILQRAVVRLQAHRRGLMVRFAYHLLLSVISKAQSVFRGRLVRRSLSALITKLMNTYKKHMFLLWSRAYTPLSYRSKFWSLLESVGFVRLALAEEEIKRLWKELKIQPPNYSENGEIKLVDALSLNASNIHYWKCLKVRADNP